MSLRERGARPRFFFLHGDYFSNGIYCRELVRHLNPDQPFLVLPPCGTDGRPVPLGYEQMAERHLEVIRAIQPHGPYMLGGECNGGLVAYEIARRLESQGEQVSVLILLSASAQNVRLARLSAWLGVVGGALRLSVTQRRYLLRRLNEFAINLRAASIPALVGLVLRKSTRIPSELVPWQRCAMAPTWRASSPNCIRPTAIGSNCVRSISNWTGATFPGAMAGALR